MGKLIFLILLPGFLLLPGKLLLSQDNSECLGCHDDKDMKTDRNGKSISLFVSGNEFGKFSHKSLKCVSCHTGFNPSDMPHKEKITPVNCKTCHKEPANIHPFHPNMKNANGISGSNDINCRNCHSYHYPETKANPASKFYYKNIANACGECHGKEKTDFLSSGHFQAASRDKNNFLNCLSCHKSPITPGWGLSQAELKQNQLNMCYSCHVKNHEGGTPAKLTVDMSKSIHGSAMLRGVSGAPACIDCHGNSHNVGGPEAATSPINKFSAIKVCSKCHINISAEFQSSVHGLALVGKNTDAPSCSYCHSEHNMNRITELPQNELTKNSLIRTNVENSRMAYCISCHTNKDLASRNGIKTIQEGHDWLMQNKRHLEMTKCTDCHSSNTHSDVAHDILLPDKAVRNCDYCHSNNSMMISVLSREDKERSIKQNGYLAGVISSEGYVKGLTHNLMIETLSWLIFFLVIAGLATHGFIRIYFRKSIRRKDGEV